MALTEDLRARGLIYQWSADELLRRLDGSSISAYVGFDPSASSLHVGNLVQILTMRRLQLAGHRPVMVVGGATGMIGDPGGRSEERNLLSDDVLEENIAGIGGQLERLVDFDTGVNGAVLRNNRDWLGGLSMIEFLRDVGKYFSVGQMIQKDSVRNRIGDERSISYTEFSYMLLQSYDFYHLHTSDLGVDLQIGGSDQWGNLTAAVDYVRRMTGDSVFAFTTPLVTKADGTKFGKSVGGAVWLDPERTSPYAMYQFFLRTDDPSVVGYLKTFTFLGLEEIEHLAASLEEAPQRREAHERLAYEVTALVHGATTALQCRRASELIFSGDLLSAERSLIEMAFSEAPSIELAGSLLGDGGIDPVDLLVETPLATSKGAARRLLGEGAIAVNGLRWSEDRRIGPDDALHGDLIVLRRGKREFCLVQIL